MKKLFLLPLVALSLVGCNNTEPGTSSSLGNWITLNQLEYKEFVVVIGGDYQVNYEIVNYLTFEYRDRRIDNYMILDVKYKVSSTKTVNNTFIGKNVNYAIY